MSDREDSLAQGDTIPKLLLEQAINRPEKTAIREKDLGIWQSWSWREAAGQVRAIACALSSYGLTRGDKVAIIGDNRPHLYWAMTACQAVGAVPVPVYQDSGADEVRRVFDHAQVRFAIVEDQEQVDKVLAVRDACPNVERVIYVDPRGLRHYEHSFLSNFEELAERGRAFDAENPEFFLDEVAKGKGSDLSVILYTSGTTGRPKGVMLSFDNIVITARNANAHEQVGDDEELLAYLPMAWVGDHIFSYGQALVGGFTVNCPESADTVMLDLRELGPTFFVAPPRIFENILTQVTVRMGGAVWLKLKMFRFFMDVADRSGARILERKPVPFLDRVLYAGGRVLVYGPLKNTLGFSRMRRAYVTGEAIGREIFDFYRSLGVNLKQLYGQTESSIYITVQRDNDVKPDTVGTPAPECQIKIGDNNEVIYRSPGAFLGYYRDPEATAEIKTTDGWVHTGDAGSIDEDGHLKIIDRLSDVGTLGDGTLFAPKYIENKLKFFPCIREAVTIGDGREYVTAFVNIDLGAVGTWAEKRGLAFTSYADLASQDDVYDLVAGSIGQANQDLAADPKLASSQIKRFLILNKELDAVDGELTRTGTVRRGIISERYGDLVDALYSARGHVSVEAKVTFEDGQEGRISADLKIRDVAAGAEPLRQAS